MAAPGHTEGAGATNSPIQPSLAVSMACAAFTGIAWYNVIELNVSVYMTFKRKRGLYFWSLVVSSWGVVLHSLGFLLKLYGLVAQYGVTVTIITVGWWAMVTGQALVLYSRLHLVVKEQRILRGVLIMIIWNAITLHIPTTVMTYGSNSPDYQAFVWPYQIMERLQMTIFCLQEFIISGIYLWATLRLLKPVYRRRTRSVMMQLLWINVCIMMMDVAMLAMEYQGNYAIETMMKAMVYSIKLKLEFAVLNQLMRLANSSQNAAVMSYNDDPHQPHHPEAAKPRSKPVALLRRVLPGRNPFHDEAHSIRSPSIPHPSAYQRKVNDMRALSTAGSPVKESVRQHSDTPGSAPTRGISLTTEITQVTSPKEKMWRPSLDRHAALSESHLRDVQTRERNASVATIYNNPAAFFPPNHRVRDPLDVLDSDDSDLDDSSSPIAGASEKAFFPPSPDSDRPAAPKTTPAATARPSTEAHRRPHLQIRPPSVATPPPAKARSPSPRSRSKEGKKSSRSSTVVPATDFPPPPGILRSTRPSVTDWAAGSEGESRTSSEVRLDPHEVAANALYDRGRVRVANDKIKEWEEREHKVEQQEKGRGGEASGGGLDFMTSAL